MPLYEYQCADCSDTFEARRPFSQANVSVPCPRCESTQTRKVFGTITLVGAATKDTMTTMPAPAHSQGGCACGGGGCGCH